jgi:dolichyl-phosphate beta-glucosyltransferase
MKAPLVSIIIPALNEASRLPRTLNCCIAFLEKQNYASEILVVTDGSKDQTAAVAESFVSQFKNMRVLSFSENRGKGFGVKSGMLAAHGKFRLFMDADNAVPIDFLSSFLEKCESGYDIIIGSRTQKTSKILKAQGFLRYRLAIIFRYIQKLVLGLPYWDTQCGFKLFTAKAAEDLFPRTTLDCAFFDAELLYMAHKAKYKVFEHPVSWHHDPDTRLPIGFRRSIELLKLLFVIKRTHVND